jgi:hypothetical protein
VANATMPHFQHFYYYMPNGPNESNFFATDVSLPHFIPKNKEDT